MKNRRITAAAFLIFNLYESCGFEGDECATLFHSLETFGRDVDGDLFAELGDEKGFLLQIDLTAALAGRVELGRTGAVGVPPAYSRALTCYVANA